MAQITESFETITVDELSITPEKEVGHYLKPGFMQKLSSTKDKTIKGSKVKYHQTSDGGIVAETVTVEIPASKVGSDVHNEEIIRGYEALQHPPRTARAAMLLKDPKTMSMKEIREFDEARGKRHYKDIFAAKFTEEMKLLATRIGKVEAR